MHRRETNKLHARNILPRVTGPKSARHTANCTRELFVRFNCAVNLQIHLHIRVKVWESNDMRMLSHKKKKSHTYCVKFTYTYLNVILVNYKETV